MSVRVPLLRLVALTLVVGGMLGSANAAKADFLKGLSIRGGAWMPVRDSVRQVVDFAAFGGGIQYELPWFPKLLNGEHWSTSISADFYYSERGNRVVRNIPVSINQVYVFEEQNGRQPYAGFSVTAATSGGHDADGYRIPTVTRFGAGLIIGLHLNSRLYIEGRYDFIDKSGGSMSVEGFRTMIGFKL